MRYLFDDWLFILFVILVGVLIFIGSYYLNSNNEIDVIVEVEETAPMPADDTSYRDAEREITDMCEQMENCRP